MSSALLRCQLTGGEQYLQKLATHVSQVRHGAIRLAETICFAEGGGQPADAGKVSGIDVEAIRDDDGSVWHRFVDAKCDRKFAVDEKVEVSIDWQRRHDHMQCHSMQHVLSAVAPYRTVGWALTEFPRPCRVEFDTKTLSEDEIAQLEDAANKIIRDGRKLTLTIITSAEEGNAHVDVSKHNFEQPMRVINIEGADDYNACCGTHVKQAGELQGVRIVGLEKAHGNVVIRFIAGQRLLHAVGESTTRDAKLSALLSTSPDRFVDTIEALKESVRAITKKSKLLQDRLSQLDTDKINADVKSDPTCTIRLFRPDADAAALLSTFKQVSVFPRVLAIVGDGCMIARGEDHAAVKEIGASLMELLGGKGGGRPGSFQGKFVATAANADLISKLFATDP